MPPRKPFRKRPDNFKARDWLPRGVSITVYDIQGTAISEKLANEISATVEKMVKESGINSLGIDVRKN